MKKQSAIESVIYEFLGAGNLSRYEELVGEDVKVHHPRSWQEIHSPYLYGRKSVKTIDQEYANAFEITKIEINDMLSSGNKIAVRWSFDGIHKGDFFGIKATRRRFDLTGQTVYQFDDEEKVGEVWQAWDMLGLFRQIGNGTVAPFLSEEMKDIGKLMRQASGLSARERECMRYLLEGKTAKETARYMNLSFRTVEYYFENIKDKLDCVDKREVFAYARRLERQRML